MSVNPGGSIRVFCGATSSSFIFGSRAITFEREAAYDGQEFQPRDTACLSYYGFRLRKAEDLHTQQIAGKSVLRLDTRDTLDTTIVPLMCLSVIPSHLSQQIPGTLMDLYREVENLDEFPEFYRNEDPVQAHTELVGTAAFAVRAMALAKGFEEPPFVTFPDDPGEQSLARALELVLGDEADALHAYRMAMERHGYRVIHGKELVNITRWPGMTPYPFEYLILKQIRTCHGLANPPFEHVLLYPEYEKLHNAFTWFDPREHPVMGQFIRLYEDWSGKRFGFA